ncbi:rubredoxin, partial [Dietzia sp. DQ11-44]
MRRYQVLRTTDDAPQLPAGYAALIVVAYFPPIWRRIMDHRVLDHYDGDVTRANIQPSKRERILARYGDPSATGASPATSRSSAPAATATAVLDPEPDVDAVRGAVSPIGTYACPNCGHHYVESLGEPREGFAPGTPWSAIPDDWQCPDCGVRDKVDFVPVS